MNNKGTLVLIEQVIMILVLSLVAAICLSVLSDSYLTARDSHLRDRSLEDMQNIAEVLQASGGDLEKTAAAFGGEAAGNTLTVSREDYLLRVEKKTDAFLGKAELTVLREGTVLSRMTVCWQEG